MIRAYDKVYLDKARTVLARMLDFAVWELGYGIDEFFVMFIKTGLAKRFAEGEFTLLVGMSGVELAYKVLEMSGIETKRIKVVYASDRSMFPTTTSQLMMMDSSMLPTARSMLQSSMRLLLPSHPLILL